MNLHVVTVGSADCGNDLLEHIFCGVGYVSHCALYAAYFFADLRVFLGGSFAHDAQARARYHSDRYALYHTSQRFAQNITSFKEPLIISRLTAGHATCLHLFRQTAQKISARRQPYLNLFVQPDEKSDCAIRTP